MMSDRCAICDADNDLRTLCHMHRVLTKKRAKVQSGELSDFGVDAARGVAINHQAQMTSGAVAYARVRRMRQYPQRANFPEAQMMIELAVLLSGCDVELDDDGSGMDSYGDGLVRYHLIDWRRINGSDSSGKAA